MGTLFKIVLYASDDSVANAAADSAFQRIEALNDILSDYKSDSELNRLSRKSGIDTFFEVSKPLFYVLDKAQELAEETSGSFDVTVGPYVQLWREMRNREALSLPAINVMKKRGQSVGYDGVITDRSNLSIALIKPDMQLDLGGIAKGYAADEALRVINGFNIYSALIDAGGDITLGDAPPGKKGWRVSIPVYSSDSDPEYITLVLSNRAIATSGDLFQYVEIEGKRYSHIIDPATGLGLTEQSTVTVLAPDGITADSYASAVSVMGPKRGIEFIESKAGIDVYIQRKENDSVVVQVSSGFEDVSGLQNK